MNIETDLSFIEEYATAKQEENGVFVASLKSMNTDELDKIVFKLNDDISSKIDCTACGNCCKTLMINVEDEEADKAAKHLNLNREVFDNLYLEKSDGGRMLIGAIPCHFLENNKCTIYESRFGGCREFPALHLPNFNKRLFTVFMHYGRCPIIFNVVEQLKYVVKK